MGFIEPEFIIAGSVSCRIKDAKFLWWVRRVLPEGVG